MTLDDMQRTILEKRHDAQQNGNTMVCYCTCGCNDKNYKRNMKKGPAHDVTYGDFIPCNTPNGCPHGNYYHEKHLDDIFGKDNAFLGLKEVNALPWICPLCKRDIIMRSEIPEIPYDDA